MLLEVIKQIKVATILLILFSILTGLIYPAVVTGVAQLIFPWAANGSLIQQDNKIIGSVLIGQSFDALDNFWSRPSATTPYPYNGENSTGSNSGPSNPDFLQTVKDRISHLKQMDPAHNQSIPVDLVTASGSGLDPEISPYAAFYQAPRIAKATKLPEAEIDALITSQIQKRTLGVLGEPRVNVLELNMALNKLRSAHGSAPSRP